MAHPPRTSRSLAVIGALLGLVLGGAPLLGLALVPAAAAQVTASPAALEVAVPAGQAAEAMLTVSNGGTGVQPLALSLAPAEGSGDGTEPGALLFTSEKLSQGYSDIAPAPEGRVFVATVAGINSTTEFTAALEYVRTFEHPTTDLLSLTVGLAYSPDTDPGEDDGSLWWMDIQREDGDIEQALLLEGTLDGAPTGRQLAFPFGEGGICGNTSGYPNKLAYDRSEGGAEGEGRFYYLDVRDDTVWAADTLGSAAPGYPVPFSDYAGVPQPPNNPEGCLINAGLDAHTLSGGEGPGGDPLPAEPLLEGLLGYPYVHPANRAYTAVVLDRAGRNRGAETPLFDLPTPDGFGSVRRLRSVVRSRLDPSVLYLVVTTGEGGASNRDWVYAVRAAPLPPVWLRAEEILFSVEGESEREVTLVLDATGLAPGTYEGVVAVREGDGIGPVVAEVPVALTVTPATDAEGDPEGDAEPVEGLSLSVYPNPSSGNAVVSLALPRTAEVRVEVFDVLGRAVAVLYEGALTAGRHELDLDGRDLPAGIYVVRATGESVSVTRRVSIVR